MSARTFTARFDSWMRAQGWLVRRNAGRIELDSKPWQGCRIGPGPRTFNTETGALDWLCSLGDGDAVRAFLAAKD